MNILVILALALFLAGGFFRQTTVKSTTPVPTPTPTLTPTEAPQSEVGPVTVTQSPTSDWQYPSSIQISAGVYQSSDPSDKITDWYQDKIKQLGLSTKTFVRTKTNDRVLNKLVAVGISMEIRVEISKNPSDPVTRITVNY